MPEVELMRFPFHRSAALLAALVSLAGSAAAAPQLVLLNGKLFTADAARPYAQALAVEDGRISAVGSDAEIRALAGPATRIVDVGGRLVTPGLVEAHVHLGWNLPSPPLPLPGLPFPGPSAEQVLAAVEAAAKTGDGWISAWVGPRVARDRRNWRDALDGVAPRRPVLLRAFWGHTTIVNSAALALLGIPEDVRDPLGGWWGRDAAESSTDAPTHRPKTSRCVRAAPDRHGLREEFKPPASATPAGASRRST
jgi:predicted amidohydrolase YtcJ